MLYYSLEIYRDWPLAYGLVIYMRSTLQWVDESLLILSDQNGYVRFFWI